MKKVFAIILVLSCACALVKGQVRMPSVSISDDYFFAGDSVAFWASHNARGLVPEYGGNTCRIALSPDSPLMVGRRNALALDYGLRSAFIFSVSEAEGNSMMVDEAFIGGSFGYVGLNIGKKRKDHDFSDITLSGGDISYSFNAPCFPGISWNLKEWTLPFLGNALSIKGSWGDYILDDNRHVRNVLLHNEEGYLSWNITPRLTLTAGFEDWGMWGGTSINGTEYLQTAGQYFHIITGTAGGAESSIFDQENVAGNHLGRSLLRLSWKGDGYGISLSKDSPFEDGSGLKQRNFPDGIWSLHFQSSNGDAWVSEAALEFIYSLCQSGPAHDIPASEEQTAHQDPGSTTYGRVILGGCDEYFNHVEYMSGWTYRGRTVGVPLFLAQSPDAAGITYGMVSNMVAGVHLGLRGRILHRYPYSFLLTAARHEGCMYQRDPFFDSKPTQFSVGLKGELPKIPSVPSLALTYGLYGDLGTLTGTLLTCSVGIRCDL